MAVATAGFATIFDLTMSFETELSIGVALRVASVPTPVEEPSIETPGTFAILFEVEETGVVVFFFRTGLTSTCGFLPSESPLVTHIL